MQVRNIMKSPVVSIDPEQSVREAAQAMRDHGIGSVVVERQGRVVGILTERDVLHAAAPGAGRAPRGSPPPWVNRRAQVSRMALKPPTPLGSKASTASPSCQCPPSAR